MFGLSLYLAVREAALLIGTWCERQITALKDLYGYTLGRADDAALQAFRLRHQETQLVPSASLLHQYIIRPPFTHAINDLFLPGKFQWLCQAFSASTIALPALMVLTSASVLIRSRVARSEPMACRTARAQTVSQDHSHFPFPKQIDGKTAYVDGSS